jgi:uncharacterized protein YerC
MSLLLIRPSEWLHGFTDNFGFSEQPDPSQGLACVLVKALNLVPERDHDEGFDFVRPICGIVFSRASKQRFIVVRLLKQASPLREKKSLRDITAGEQTTEPTVVVVTLAQNF